MVINATVAQKTGVVRVTVKAPDPVLAQQLDSALLDRVNVFNQNRGPGAVMRAIPTVIPTMEQLGLGPVFKELCTKERGTRQVAHAVSVYAYSSTHCAMHRESLMQSASCCTF